MELLELIPLDLVEVVPVVLLHRDVPQEELEQMAVMVVPES
jgi:hypothetical protein